MDECNGDIYCEECKKLVEKIEEENKMKKVIMGKDKETGKDKLQIFNPIDERKIREKEIFKKYPKIFRQKNLSIRESCMPWGLDCGIGWFDLIDDLCSKIQKICNKRGFQTETVQVKEKFGELRFYVYNSNDEIDDLISKAEEKSYKICENCGSEDGVTQSKGWIVSLCKTCMKDYKKKRGG
jgi:hypothetical protein